MIDAQENILVVGAGGIGGELVKNLFLSGFRNITVIDLDLIENSNLHRQFFFRKQDVQRSKALCLQKRLYQATGHWVTAFFGDITDNGLFPPSFFSSFSILMNAVDNNEARSYLNKIGLLFTLPVFECGSGGYHGQAYLIKSPETECYDCISRTNIETIPICTIRTIPTNITHCVIWARDHLRPLLAQPASECPGPSCPILTFLNEAGKDCLHVDGLCTELTEVHTVFCRTKEHPHKRKRVGNHQLHVSLLELVLALKKEGKQEYSKDDKNMVDFVWFFTCLRAKIYHIAIPSKLEITTIAGNIIPALPSTNSVVAGLVVCLLWRYKTKGASTCRIEYLLGGFHGWLLQEEPSRPNPKCPSCSCPRRLVLVDFSETTLMVLLAQEHLQNNVSVFLGTKLLYDPEDLPDNLPRMLRDLGVTTGSELLLRGDETLFLHLEDSKG